LDENSIDSVLKRWRSVSANQRRRPEQTCTRRGRFEVVARVAPGQPEKGNVKNTMASNDI
jgi:hypothetical protein